MYADEGRETTRPNSSKQHRQNASYNPRFTHRQKSSQICRVVVIMYVLQLMLPIPAPISVPRYLFLCSLGLFNFFYTYFVVLFILFIIHTDLYRPLLLFLTIILAGFMAMTESLATANRNAESYLTYSTVKGYFLQDEEDTDSSRFDYVFPLHLRLLSEWS